MSRDLAELLPHHPLPSPDGGKDAKGDLVLVGGAPSCPGAVLLAGRAALRSGSGRVQLVVHPDVAAAIGVALPEALVLGWDPRDELPAPVAERLARAAAVVVGPGMGEEAQAAARAAEHHAEGVLVVDAQATGCLADLASGHKGTLVAAPNPKEAADLLDCGGDATDAVGPLARDLADLLGGPAAVRGTTTVLDDGAGSQWAESERTPGLGTPGSGDVLMGALGAMLARGMTPLGALAWAIAAHARAGRLLGDDIFVGFLASEVADALPRALRLLSEEAGRSSRG